MPEAAELESFTDGVAQVRDRIARETAGAIDPRRQLLAIGQILKTHDKALAHVVRACSERNDRVLAPADAFQFVLSLVQYAALALQWLALSSEFRKLPVEGRLRRDLSVQKSLAARNNAVRVIKERLALARELIADLGNLLPGNPTIEHVLSSLSIEMMCLEIKAALLNASNSGAVPVPRTAKEQMLRDVKAVRIAPDFARRSQSDQQLVWQVEGELHGELEEVHELRHALREQHRLTVGNSDARARLLVELMRAAESDEERVALLSEVTALGRRSRLGPIFSSERVGRISILRDAMWAMAVLVDPDSAYAPHAVDEALLCDQIWMYGTDARPATNALRLVATWGGRGRVTWESEGQGHLADFRIDPGLESAFFTAMESTRATRGRSLAKILKALDAELGPELADAIAGRGEVRLHAGGSAALLPLLMIQVGTVPLGADSRVAYAHPNPQIALRAGHTRPMELLIVDDSFAESDEVRAALRRAAERASADCRILRLDSRDGGFELSSDELAAALQAVSTAVIFCHIDTPMMYASETAIVAGPAARYRVEELAALNLQALDELVLIGCASGRSNPFVGGATVAHAGALAGANQVLFTMWPVRSTRGAEFLRGLIDARTSGTTTAEYLASVYERDRIRAGDFAIMRPGPPARATV
jgi:CHAT domain-containing protein